MTDTLPGLEDQTPPAGPFIVSLLTNALIADDAMTLPELAATADCKTNAEVEAHYAAWYRDTYTFLMHASLAHVLIRLEENHPNLAAGIAAEVKDWLEAGDAYPELIWEWATKRGLDPEKIRADARTAHEEWLATVPRHLHTAVPLDGTEVAP
ncbi:hypothetical protein [Agromyces aureus]|uniref:Uncharacterized protein n=1 Tax=Agromyces aureus TaxID=453304 RepID=A0A191WET9_9MICO|nr:hypothetical protein [Agromyces aureus]ANJ26790.1 hypothetical protein ATC03_08755 [Agromyces aureus]